MVQAQDTGKPSLSSTVTVYFNVIDLNDNAPIFDPMSYSNEIFENVTIGTNVITVSATDLDSGKYRGFRISGPFYLFLLLVRKIVAREYFRDRPNFRRDPS